MGKDKKITRERLAEMASSGSGFDESRIADVSDKKKGTFRTLALYFHASIR